MNVEQKYEHYKDVKTSENYVSTKYSQLKICLSVSCFTLDDLMGGIK